MDNSSEGSEWSRTGGNEGHARLFPRLHPEWSVTRVTQYVNKQELQALTVVASSRAW
jgi:hypothetical protein